MSEPITTSVEQQKAAVNPRVVARQRADSIFARAVFIPLLIAVGMLFVLFFDVLTDTVSWQVVETANSGKTFAFAEGFLNGKAIFRRELEAQGLSKEEVASTIDDPDEYRKLGLRNRVQLMLWTPDGLLRWTVVSIRDKLEENYGLFEGWGKLAQIQSELTEGQRLYLNPWLDTSYFQFNASRSPQTAGLRGASLGSLIVTFFVIIFVIPIGVGAAIYLEEYAPKNRFSRFLEVNIRNLAGVPSIVYGVLGLYLFVRFLKFGPVVISASLTLALLVLPIVVIAAREAIRAVPDSLRQASYGLGASKWQTMQRVVLPYATPGIATGLLLAISRAIGETAPLLLVGAAAYVPFDPNGPFSEYTVIPVQIYAWISENDPEFKNVAAVAILVLLVFLLTFNQLIQRVRRRFGSR
ncbi:MAG: phosphate ABC transporter permease PstA [Deinococcales bacterium]